MPTEITVSRAAHRASEEVAQALVSKADYDALATEKQQWREGYERIEYAFTLSMDITECHQAMSEYASIVYDMAMIVLAEQNTTLQSQLAAAHESQLLAEADLEAVLTELRTYFTARTYGERGDARVQLKVLSRAAHPGQALADEVAAARADAPIKAGIIAIFRRIDYGGMPDGELLTRLLIELDPWFPDDLRTPEELKKKKARVE
jgi:hypothetical protein